MRPMQFLITAFAILVLMLLVARLIGGKPLMIKAVKYFIPLCFLAASYNMSIGVRQEGYGVLEELPFLLLNFGVPSLVALWALRRLLRK